MFRKPKGIADDKLGIPQGTLHLLILTIVRREPLHGYGIAQRLQSLTNGAFQINPGSLFPALYALERDAMLRCEERSSENNRKARYYRITTEGRGQLKAESARLLRYAATLTAILG